MTSLDARMKTNRHTNGFDCVRLGLALCVLCIHSATLNRGEFPPLIAAMFRLVLPMFFALSGFLVAGSLNRARNLGQFALLRILRIFPALSVVVAITALVLGPLLSRFPAGDYFSHPAFASYFWNALGIVHYRLPGVFSRNPEHGVVNGSLWTIGLELLCYAGLVVASAAGLMRRRRLFVFLAIAASTVIPLGIFLSGNELLFGAVQGRVLIFCFLAGTVLQSGAARIPLNTVIAALCGAASLYLFSDPVLAYLGPFPLAYWTIWLGTRAVPPLPVIARGDYSYGLYLCAYPVQQSCLLLVPAAHLWWVNLLVALPIAFGYAVLSWHVIEKPVLSRKHAIIAIAAPGIMAPANR